MHFSFILFSSTPCSICNLVFTTLDVFKYCFQINWRLRGQFFWLFLKYFFVCVCALTNELLSKILHKKPLFSVSKSSLLNTPQNIFQHKSHLAISNKASNRYKIISLKSCDIGELERKLKIHL